MCGTVELELVVDLFGRLRISGPQDEPVGLGSGEKLLHQFEALIKVSKVLRRRGLDQALEEQLTNPEEAPVATTALAAMIVIVTVL